MYSNVLPLHSPTNLACSATHRHCLSAVSCARTASMMTWCSMCHTQVHTHLLTFQLDAWPQQVRLPRQWHAIYAHYTVHVDHHLSLPYFALYTRTCARVLPLLSLNRTPACLASTSHHCLMPYTVTPLSSLSESCCAPLRWPKLIILGRHLCMQVSAQQCHWETSSNVLAWYALAPHPHALSSCLTCHQYHPHTVHYLLLLHPAPSHHTCRDPYTHRAISIVPTSTLLPHSAPSHCTHRNPYACGAILSTFTRLVVGMQ